MDELIIKKLTEEDYDTLVKWWHDWGWAAPGKDFLPNDGTGGYMILDGEVPICAGFIYMTNSKVAWVDWIISNKEYKKKPTRGEAIKLLVAALTQICSDAGKKYCYALIKNQSLIDTYKDLGYVKGDEYVGEMIKLL